MALGIVSDDIFDQELQKFLDPVIKVSRQGEGNDKEHVPDTIRKVLADTRLESGKDAADKLGEFLNVGDRSIEAYSKGRHHLDGETKVNGLGQHIARTKERIAMKAGNLALTALEAITSEKLDSASATELAGIARASASIVKDMIPEPASDRPAAVAQIILHAPKISSEERYKVIDVVSTSDE